MQSYITMMNSRNTSSAGSVPSGYAVVEKINHVLPTIGGHVEYHPYDNSIPLSSQSQRPRTPPPDYEEKPQHKWPLYIGQSVSTENDYASMESNYPSCDTISNSRDSESSLISNEKICQKCPCYQKVCCISVVLVLLLGIGFVLFMDAMGIVEMNIFNSKDRQTGNDNNPKDIRACEDSYTLHISKSRTITCSLSNVSIGGNDTVIMRKTGMQNSEALMKRLYFQADNSMGKLVVTFTLMDTRCTDRGNYSISINTSDSFNDIYHFFLDVEDSPDKPTLTKKSDTRDYIAGEALQLQCKAIVGCTMKNFEMKRKPSQTNIYQNVQQGMGNYSVQKTDFDEYEVTMDFISTLTDQSNGDEFVCGVKGTNVVSNAYTVSTVPADFCKNRTVNCDYRHPSRCDMWVICETEEDPAIQRCGPSQYYRPAPDCICCVKHECVNPKDAGCPYE